MLKLEQWRLDITNMGELLYADDMAIVTETEEDLQYNMEILNEELKKTNMKIKKKHTMLREIEEEATK